MLVVIDVMPNTYLLCKKEGKKKNNPALFITVTPGYSSELSVYLKFSK